MPPKRKNPSISSRVLKDIDDSIAAGRTSQDISNYLMKLAVTKMTKPPVTRRRKTVKSSSKPLASTRKSKGITKNTAKVTRTKKKIANASKDKAILKVEISIKNPERFLLGPSKWMLLSATQLAQQCKIIGISSSGTRKERYQRLMAWRENPAKFEEKTGTGSIALYK